MSSNPSGVAMLGTCASVTAADLSVGFIAGQRTRTSKLVVDDEVTVPQRHDLP